MSLREQLALELEDDLDSCLEEVYIDIQHQIGRLMELQVTSIEELAAEAEIERADLDAMLNSGENFSLENIVKICIALEVRPEVLLREKHKHKKFAGLKRFEELHALQQDIAMFGATFSLFPELSYTETSLEFSSDEPARTRLLWSVAS